MTNSLPRSNPGWGKKLVEALTKGQVETLLDVLVGAGDPLRLPEELRILDSDLADTVQRLVGEADTVAAKDSDAAVSKQKLLEIWDDLWGRWNDHVCEVGDEDGEYAIKDRDWDPPYFDPTALSDDLERIAKEMQQMLEPISGLIDDPELFVKAADEIDDNIGSFPEWMGVEECCELGFCTTNCILEWTWRAMEREEMAAEQFLERIFKLDNDASYVRLNIGAALDFFAGLPENVSSKIYSDLSQEKYAAKRNDLPSIWHLIHHRYEQRFDPAAYLRSCAKHMESDWRYGESLIAAAISRGDFAQAESFVERTFVSLLGAKEIWRPEDRLLETAPQYYSGALETGAVPKLLLIWETVAVQRGDQARAAACRLQRFARASATDWPAMLDAFSEFQSRGGTHVTGEKLFAEWRNKVVEWCAPNNQRGTQPADSWIYWLIEARRNPLTHRSSLLNRLQMWLGSFAERPAFFQDNWQILALLTRNLSSAEQIEERYPTFHAHVLAAEHKLGATLEKSLREALTHLSVGPTEIELIPIWQQHLHLLVPSPDSGGSNYKSHALMMKALVEVNRVSYDGIIVKWKALYRRRRNLWAEMATLKLPGL